MAAAEAGHAGADGSVRWRIVVDAGRDPETGKRRQLTHTFDRQKEAIAELARVQHERNKGTYVAPKQAHAERDAGRVAEVGHVREGGREPRSNYAHALRPARKRLGERLVQSITREDIEDLRDWMMSAGRKRGGTPGTGLGPRSVRLTLSRLGAAFDQALDDGKVTRNPCARVRRPKMTAKHQDVMVSRGGPAVPRRGRLGPAARRVAHGHVRRAAGGDLRRPVGGGHRPAGADVDYRQPCA